jgi:hypothetical protein
VQTDAGTLEPFHSRKVLEFRCFQRLFLLGQRLYDLHRHRTRCRSYFGVLEAADAILN